MSIIKLSPQHEQEILAGSGPPMPKLQLPIVSRCYHLKHELVGLEGTWGKVPFTFHGNLKTMLDPHGFSVVQATFYPRTRKEQVHRWKIELAPGGLGGGFTLALLPDLSRLQPMRALKTSNHQEAIYAFTRVMLKWILTEEVERAQGESAVELSRPGDFLSARFHRHRKVFWGSIPIHLHQERYRTWACIDWWPMAELSYELNHGWIHPESLHYFLEYLTVDPLQQELLGLDLEAMLIATLEGLSHG